MADPRTFECAVITPERVVLECVARFVALPAHDGELGILPRRAPLILKLGIGRLRVETPEERHVFFLDGGFAQMVENRLTILSEDARRPEEIDPRRARESLAEARAMPVGDDASFRARQRALRRARVQIGLVE